MPPGVKGRRTAPYEFPEAMTVHPTMEEFKDFGKYIDHLETLGAHKAGIVKIVPPEEWVPRRKGYDLDDLNLTIEGPIKQHFNQVGSRGCYQTKGIIKQKMTVKEYHELAHSHQYKTPTHCSYEDLERKYWKSLSFVPPIYGCDVSNAISDPDLNVWNIAKLDSVLKYVSEDLETHIQGVNTPYLYFGMWKATFSWHVEDMDLYGINMVHYGAPKTWYCVPPKYGHLLEQAARSIFPNVASWCSNFMRHKTCLIAPHVLDQYGVPYQKVVQEARNIIIVFPYAYHSGFNHGFNIAESTNFATERWIEYGKRQRPCDCSRSRVKFTMDPFVKRFQPDMYAHWMSGDDIAPHPEDPPEVAAEIRLRAQNPAEYARQAEEKLRKAEEKRRSKQKAKIVTADPDAAMVLVCRHVELAHVEVEVNKKTFKFRSGRNLLQDFCGIEDPDAKDLLDRGVLIKVTERVLHRPSPKKRTSTTASSSSSVAEEIPVAVYKHVNDDLEAIVDPATLELLDPNPDLMEFFKGEPCTMSQLIAAGVFIKNFDGVYKINKTLEQEEPKPPKVAKIDLNSAPEVTTTTTNATPTPTKVSVHERPAKEIKVDSKKGAPCTVYKHRYTGGFLTVSAKFKKVIGRKSEHVTRMLNNKSIDQLEDEGIIIKVGSRVVDVENLEQHKTVPATSIWWSPFVLDINGEPREVNVASNGRKVVYNFTSSEETLAILKAEKFESLVASKTLVGSNHECPLTWEVVEPMLSKKARLRSCEGHRAQGQQNALIPNCQCGIAGLVGIYKGMLGKKFSGQPSNNEEVTYTFNKEARTMSFLKTENDDYYFVMYDNAAKKHFSDQAVMPIPPVVVTEEVPIKAEEEEVPIKSEEEVSSSIDVQPPKEEPKTEEPSEVVVKEEEEEEEEEEGEDSESEVFTSDEEELSNEESSDDPDYGGGYKEVEWKRSRPYRKNRKKMAKLMKEQTQGRGRRRRSGQYAKIKHDRLINKLALECTALVGITKSITQLPFALHEVFTIDQLTERLSVDKALVIAALLVFKGLRVVAKVSGGEESYKWTGYSMAKLHSVMMTILNGTDKNIDNAMWRMCKEVIVEMLTARRGSRIYIPLMARKYGADETRRLSLVCAILEGLNLVEKKTDEMEGMVYIGADIYIEWRTRHFDLNQEEYDLKELSVDLKPVQVQPEHIVPFKPPTFSPTKMADTDGKDERKLKSIKNRNVVCRCGTTKPWPKKEGGKVNRQRVYVGGKRRMRCKECEGCLAPKCNKCDFCLYKQLKKPCQERVCLYPKVPNCPCFK